jgi:small GTP-binding protein
MSSLKICVIGDTDVGKSSIVSRFVKRSKVPVVYHTVGVEVTITTIKIWSDVHRVKFYDMSGTLGYESLYDQYLQNCSSIVVVYDITRFKTFVRAKVMLRRIYSIHGPDFPVLLIGNKSDQIPKRRVTTEDALRHVKAFGNVFFVECSASEGHNTLEALKMLVAEASRSPFKIDSDDINVNNATSGRCVVV